MDSTVVVSIFPPSYYRHCRWTNIVDSGAMDRQIKNGKTEKDDVEGSSLSCELFIELTAPCKNEYKDHTENGDDKEDTQL